MIWVSNNSGCGSFAHKPLLGTTFFLCSYAHVLHMFLVQKSVPNIVVLSNCIFGKYKYGSGDMSSHVPPDLFFVLFFSILIMPTSLPCCHMTRKLFLSPVSFHVIFLSSSFVIFETCSVSTPVDTFRLRNRDSFILTCIVFLFFMSYLPCCMLLTPKLRS